MWQVEALPTLANGGRRSGANTNDSKNVWSSHLFLEKIVLREYTYFLASSPCSSHIPTYCTEWTNYFVDTKAKCRHLKKITCKGTLDWRCSQSRWYFRPSFVNCCPLPFSLVQLSPLPLPCVNKFTVYLQQSSFTGNFFRWRYFALPAMSLIFLRCAV